MSTWFFLMVLGVSRGPVEIGDASPDPELTRPNPDAVRVDVKGRGVFALQWRQSVVRTGFNRSVVESFGRPAVSARHGVVVVGTGEGNVFGLSWADGSQLWHYAHGTPFETGAAVVKGAGGLDIAVLGSRDGTLLAFDVTTGKLQWHAAIEGDMRAPPLQAGDRLIVTTAANKVLAVQARDGKILWNQGRTAGPGLSVEGHARATVMGDRVYATFSDGYVAAFALDQGSVLWQRPLSVRGGAAFVDADADPFVADGRLYAASYSDGIYALNPEDGTTLWNRAAPAVTSIVRQGNLVVAGSADGFVWGLRLADGGRHFRTRVAQGPISRMVSVGPMVAFTAGPSGFVVLRGDSGQPVQATGLGGRALGDPACAGANLAFFTSAGYLYAWATDLPTGCPE